MPSPCDRRIFRRWRGDIMIASHFFICQPPPSGNLNFPSGSPHPGLFHFFWRADQFAGKNGVQKRRDMLRTTRNGDGKNLNRKTRRGRGAGLLASVPPCLIPGMLRFIGVKPLDERFEIGYRSPSANNGRVVDVQDLQFPRSTSSFLFCACDE